MIDPKELERTSGCGVQGCLIAAVALFAILFIAMLVIAAMRFSHAPEGQGVPTPVGMRLRLEVGVEGGPYRGLRGGTTAATAVEPSSSLPL